MRELKVVLDTNVIYNAETAFLLKKRVRDLINASSSHKDLLITWCLPEVVRYEREYQLREAAKKAVPTVNKLERMLDLDLGITEQLIVDRLQHRIDRQINQLNIRMLTVNPAQVDWLKMVSDAAFRQPPFTPGEKEKGFRDAVIVETVSQFVASSSSGRVVVVTSDQPLTEALRNSMPQDVYLLSSIEELTGLISTLVSKVDEGFIQQMKVAATGFFFEPKNEETFFYKGEIKDKILRRFMSLILTIPEGANEVQRGKTLVSHPRFRDKVDDRMWWVSRIAFRVKAYNEAWSSTMAVPVGISTVGYDASSGYTFVDDDDDPSNVVEGVVLQEIRNPIRYSLSPIPSKIGHVAFDVIWSVTVTPQRQLTEPKVESIDYVETSWQG